MKRKRILGLYLLGMFLVSCFGAAAPAATISVRPGAYPDIQDAIGLAAAGDEIVIEPGWYPGCAGFMGKAITVRSTNPDDPAVVAATVICDLECFCFYQNEGRGSVVAGLTLLGGGVPYAILCASSPTIRNCVFDDNDIGIVINGDPLIQNCTFRNIHDSAIQVRYGAPTIDVCTMCDGGHAIDCEPEEREGCTPTLSRCTIVNNHAPYGVVVGMFGGQLTIRDSLIRNNTNPNSPITGCSFSLYGGSLTVEGCTIVGNSGGFVRAPDGQTFQPHGPLVLRDTILWGNPGGPILPDPAASAAPVDISYSVVEGGCAGTGVLNVDPALLPNGRLSPNSPCINAGDPAFVPAAGELDLDGQPRVIANRVDIGADEFATPGDINADGSVDVVDLLYFVASWGLTSGDLGYDARCDFNGDGSVDVVDLLHMAENWDQ